VVQDDFNDGNPATNTGGVGLGWNVGTFNGAPAPTESGGTFKAQMGTVNGIGTLHGKDIIPVWSSTGASVTWVIKNITIQTPHAYSMYLAYCWEMGLVSANASNAASSWVMSGPNTKGGIYVSLGKKDNSNAVEMWVAVSNKNYSGTEGTSGFLRPTHASGSVLGPRWTATFPIEVTLSVTDSRWTVTTNQTGVAPVTGNWTSDLIRDTNNASITTEFQNGAFIFTAGRNHGISTPPPASYTPNSGEMESVTAQTANTVATPAITPAGGTFNGTVQVTMTTATDGATIRYTTDGATPTAGSTAYTDPFTLTYASTTTVKAEGFKEGVPDSGVASVTFYLASSMDGPLRPHPTNPRYFTDGAGKAIYLTGSHTWGNLIDGWLTNGRNTDPAPAFDYDGYLDFLQANNHNFIRLWAADTPKLDYTSVAGGWYYPSPLPWPRTGPGNAADGKPKFDLSQHNQPYFDRLRERVVAARDRGIYVGVMLFEGFSVRVKTGALGWNYSPFRAQNNVQGYNGDTNGDGKGFEAHSLQVADLVSVHEAYVTKVINTLNDLDNVLYEISNEEGNGLGGTTARDWQHHLVDHIHDVEAGKPNQHPVGISCIYNLDNTTANNTWLTTSPADWIAPWGPGESDLDLNTNPVPAGGVKVEFADTDHVFGVGGDGTWVWKVFTRGYNVIYMDFYGPVEWTAWTPPAGYNRDGANAAMGHTLSYANRMDLASMTPQGALSSTGYCLANPGSEYLVFQPGSGAFTVNVAAGSYAWEWFNPATGAVASSGSVAGGSQSFTPPFSGTAVLYLKSTDSNQVLTPVISPNGGPFTTSVQVSITCGTGEAEIRHTTNGDEPTATSALYAAPFTLTSTTTVKAKAFKSGMTASATARATFTSSASGQTPHGGTPWPIPGTIQGEDYDDGGEGVAYHDYESQNRGGAYRTSEGVDVASLTGGGHAVTYVREGEWLEYTVNVATSGTYAVTYRVSNETTGGRFHVEVDGVDGTGPIVVPNTGSWDVYGTVTHPLSLTSGAHVLRVVFDVATLAGGLGVANLDWLEARLEGADAGTSWDASVGVDAASGADAGVAPDGSTSMDGAVVVEDGGTVTGQDGGVVELDGGGVEGDGGVVEGDGGLVVADGGGVVGDASVTVADGSVTHPDAGALPGDEDDGAEPPGCACGSSDTTGWGGGTLLAALLFLVRRRRVRES
jgi:MYXO-CTERM domain-containing protein